MVKKDYVNKRVKASKRWWRKLQKPFPTKIEKKATRKDEVGPNRILGKKRTLSVVTPSKGEIETNVGSLVKTPPPPKKSKVKEKIRVKGELLRYVDFHPLSWSDNANSLLVLPLNNQGRGKGGK
jgi:hypothetical protein